MSGVNSVTIIGRLGQDPETRQLQNGGSVTTCSVATSEKWRDKQTGQVQERAEWHRITMFGKLAEIAAQYLRKGSMACFCGSLKTDKYEKDGQTHYATKIVAKELQMLDGKQETAKTDDGYAQAKGRSQPRAQLPDDDDFGVQF